MTFVGLSGVVPADGVDGEAISRSLEGNSLADNIKPDGLLRKNPVSERGIHVRYCTSNSRKRSCGDKNKYASLGIPCARKRISASRRSRRTCIGVGVTRSSNTVDRMPKQKQAEKGQSRTERRKITKMEKRNTISKESNEERDMVPSGGGLGSVRDEVGQNFKNSDDQIGKDRTKDQAGDN